MLRRRMCLLVGMALVLCACGRQQSSGPAPSAANASARAAAPGTVAPKPTAHDKTAEADLATINHLNEDGSETVEETPGDTGSRNQLLAAVASTVTAATSTAAAATLPGTQWQEGVNYTRLVPAQPTSVAAGQVEVLEFFWYACPHCYALEPLVETWSKSKPAYVSFSPVPVLWNENHRSLARLYYALDTLGKANQYHGDIFKEIQVNNDPLIGADPNNAAQAERVQLAFIKRLGISEDAFEKEYHGFNVETAMGKADQLALRYKITAVPTFVVNGKYIADATSAGGPDRLMALITDLAAQEHKH
jgi:protein dithiol oxidoreductase (disulfide-forming)